MSFDCSDCKASIPGTNCAFSLSRAFGWKTKSGCYAHCKCGYPVRAKEVRDNIFSDLIDQDKKAAENAYIYCENSNGNGHVCYGTYNTCVYGNNFTAARMNNGKGATVFQRYASAD